MKKRVSSFSLAAPLIETPLQTLPLEADKKIFPQNEVPWRRSSRRLGKVV
jgi:hypothetical protein